MQKIQVTSSSCEIKDGLMCGYIEGVFTQFKRYTFVLDFHDSLLLYAIQNTRILTLDILENGEPKWMFKEYHEFDHIKDVKCKKLLYDLLEYLEIAWPSLFKVEIRELAWKTYVIETNNNQSISRILQRKMVLN